MIPRRAPCTTGEAGETLTELLVTIMIMGFAIVALLGGLASAILTSDLHRKYATGDTIARNVAEALKDRTVAWVPTGAYSNTTWSAVDTSGYSVTVSAQCWSNQDSYNPPSFGACVPPDLGLQQLTVTTTSNGGSTADSVTVLKRKT